MVNAGVSGETSAGGLRRIDWLLRQPIAVLALELGANDMLRGQDVRSMRANLQEIIDRTRAAHPRARIIIAGMQAAPNLGPDAIQRWATYTPLDIARRIPNMVQGDWMGGLIDVDNLLDKRPFAELGQYKAPVDNLYMCGATQHPHGFVTFAPAYNALQVIADDYGLDRWWR